MTILIDCGLCNLRLILDTNLSAKKKDYIFYDIFIGNVYMEVGFKKSPVKKLIKFYYLESKKN